MQFNDTLKHEIDNAVLCWLASVGEDGMPNVSPKEIFSSLGENRIIIADIASPKSTSNIKANPLVCVSFVDVFRQRGFKLNGQAVLGDPDDADFASAADKLRMLAGPDFAIRSIIDVTVTKVSRIWAPSYALFPERSDSDRISAAYRTYGVRPLG